jgi:hypothetical protein
MCTKISSMVQRLSTPIDLKLRLIPIFQHMHHDVGTASMVCIAMKAVYKISFPNFEITKTHYNLSQILKISTTRHNLRLVIIP